MMGASNAARSWDDQTAPVAQPRSRSWAETVPYDMLDAGESADPLTPPARARRGPAPSTAHLQAMPGGRREGITYRPPAAPAAEPAPAYERTYQPRPAALGAASTMRMALYGLGAAAAAVVLYLIVSTLVTWTQIKLDDMQYGTPRTTHLDAVVGNGDSAAQPTHFIAINLYRQVSIIELRAGDISKAVASAWPALFVHGEDQTQTGL